MDNFGFIHGELDTKLLILFILRRLPRPVDGDTLTAYPMETGQAIRKVN